jgi:hypothetical protein
MYLTRRGAIAGLLLAVPGCNLFRTVEEGGGLTGGSLLWGGGNLEKGADRNGSGLQLRTARLEALIVSRPAEDVRLRRLVWEELDESGLMSPEQRQRLNRAGMRIGVAGGGIPWALESLVRESTAAEQLEADGTSRRSVVGGGTAGQGFSLMPGGQSYLELQSGLEDKSLPLAKISELSGLRDRTQLRCVMEVTAKEVEGEWVLLNLLPVVYAGAAAPRLTIEDHTEQLPVRQNVLPLYEYQMEVRLLTGEVAVVGRHAMAGAGSWCVGNLFFQPEQGVRGTERLLMIRMGGIEVLEGRSDPGFRLGAYEKK